MTEPMSFPSSTARLGLPLLFAAQAQKEFFINEAHVLSDILHHATVEGTASSPPSSPNDGQCWLVGTGATGEFAGHDAAVAGWQQGQWIFVTPVEGMTVFDRSTLHRWYYRSGWQKAAGVAIPTQGSVIDAQARSAIVALTEALRVAGIVP